MDIFVSAIANMHVYYFNLLALQNISSLLANIMWQICTLQISKSTYENVIEFHLLSEKKIENCNPLRKVHLGLAKVRGKISILQCAAIDTSS